MESIDLRTVRAKIDRAEHHLRDIDAALKLVLGTEPNSKMPVTFNKDYERKQLIVNLKECEPIDPALPLMIGDCIHNFRSALDHLVYRLALKNSAPPKAASKTFFPIYLTKPKFDERVEKLVKPFISSSALAEIEKCQPYRAYDVPGEADIWIISQLDIFDKHRLLVVAGQKFAATEFTVTSPAGERFHEVISEPKWKAMEDGAEVLRFDFSQVFNPPSKMQVHIDLVTTVQLVDTGLACDGVIVQTALRQFMSIVSAIVRDFGRDFFAE